MIPIKDMSGLKFGRLTAIKFAYIKNGDAWFLCKCDCGKEKFIRGASLRNGHTLSCGCSRDENFRATITHGQTIGKKTKAYCSWDCMMQRCTNPHSRAYHNYGGRGITICNEWISFENFIRDMGNPPSKKHTLERVDNNKGYSPDNCKWETRKVQCNNKRTNHIIEFNGQKKNIKQWSEFLHVNYGSLMTRFRLGWSIEKAFLTPIKSVTTQRLRI